MVRSWGFVTLTGAAQPVFGDVLTAAVALPGATGIIAVTVASTTRYGAGDRIVLDPGQATQDILLVQNVFSSTVLWCVSEGEAKTHVHANGAIILLSIPCAEALLTGLLTNSGTTYVGSDATVTAVPGGSAFTYVTAGGSYNLGVPEWNTIRTSDIWMIGTAADKIGVAAIVI